MQTRAHQVFRSQLLAQEVARINHWLGEFECRNRPVAGLGSSQETLWVRLFPLPDALGLENIHLAMVVRDYPVEPPKGLYLLQDERTRRLVTRLRHQFNTFGDRAFHGAPSVKDYEWICVGYLDGWRFDVHQPARGDNVLKMLVEFWRLLEATC
jgi:hypothetical protein